MSEAKIVVVPVADTNVNIKSIEIQAEAIEWIEIALSRAGYRIDALIGREKVDSRITRYISPRPKLLALSAVDEIHSDVVLVTTPDRSIADVSLQLSKLLSAKKQYIFHTSGSLSSNILHKLAKPGRKIGSIHPLVSVSSPLMGSKLFTGAYFCVEGDDMAVRAGTQIAKNLGALPFSLATESKPLYHLAAVMAAGHLVALIDVAFSLMSKTGVGDEKARLILLPLIKSAVKNLETRRTPEAITGPITRGDTPVIERHLEILTSVGSTNEIEIYLDLALRSIEIAERLDSEHKFDELRKLILLAKQNTK
jgi:predicted short-subunit dehydrogenase-like oxidoreductase (DUF2520 family)